MNRIGAFHAPATFAFREKELTVQLFLPDGERDVEELWLCYTVTMRDGKGGNAARVRMLPADGFTARDSFSLYRAKIPARDLVGGELLYTFLRGDEESETYSVTLCDAPTMPPLMISELSPWNGEACSFLELYNPTRHVVDLFDFELLLFVNGKPAGRNPLANAPRKGMLGAGELAAVHFRFAKAEPDFLAEMASTFPDECGDIAEIAPTVFCVRVSDSEGFLLPRYSFQYYTYHIVPRGGSAKDAVFSVTLNDGCVDIRRTRSVLIDTDPRQPSQGRVAKRLESPTPGYRGEEEWMPNLDDTAPPAILPIEPEGRCRITGGDLKVRFAVIAKNVAAATVFLRVGKDFRSFPAVLQNDGIWESSIPHATLLGIGARFSYYIEVRGGLYTATCGDCHTPMTLRISDGAGPTIVATYPAKGEVIENQREPRICVQYADFSGINPRVSIFCLDGKNLSDRAEWHENAVYYTPDRPLSFGTHVLEISLRDMTGNRTYRRIPFTVSDGKTLYCFRGELHAHTATSDGTGLFEKAYPYARDVGKVDFFAVTDHSQYLTDGEFESCRAGARGEAREGFVPLFGEEVTWSHREGYWGHMNLIEPKRRISALDVDLQGLYKILAEDADAIAMFNHPGDLWGDFDGFGHIDPAIRERVCLAEIPDASYDGAYALALSRGWYVAPFSSEDNHGKEWTTETRGTGVLLSPALTRENLLDAIRRRRAYSTTDNSLQLMFAVNRTPLGGVLHAPQKLSATVWATTAASEGLGVFQVIAEDNIVVAEVNAGVARDFSWEVELSPDFDYYYLRIRNGKEYTVTAPVFVTGRDLLTVTDMTLGVTEDADLPHAVALTVKNTGEHTLTDLSIDLYLTPCGGFRLRDAVPFASVTFDQLEGGAEHRTVRAIPFVAGNQRVSAVVSGHLGKHRFADTSYRLLSPVYVAKIMPLSAGEGEWENPYPYVELCNPTARDLSLDGYVLRRRRIVGREPLPREMLSLNGALIPANGRLVIWRKPKGSSLTAADFNARYGTALTEGVDLLITEQAILTPSPFGSRVELCLGDEVLCRAACGNYCKEEKIVCDQPLLFAAPEDMTPNARELPSEEGVLPLDAVVGATLPLYDKAVLSVKDASEHEKGAHKRVTKLAHKPLVPLQAAALLAGAVSAFKDIFRSKE